MNGRTCVLLLVGAMAITLTSVLALPLVLLRPSAQGAPEPILVQNLPARFAEAEPVFRARIAEAFPPRSSEAALIQRLRIENFDLRNVVLPESDSNDEHWASVTRSSSACALTWRVRWRAEAGQLVSASGDYKGTCL